MVSSAKICPHSEGFGACIADQLQTLEHCLMHPQTQEDGSLLHLIPYVHRVVLSNLLKPGHSATIPTFTLPPPPPPSLITAFFLLSHPPLHTLSPRC